MKQIVLIFFAVVVIGLSANTTYSWSIAEPTIETHDGYDFIQIPETLQHGKTGEPTLPYAGITLALPVGEEATDVTVIKHGRHLLTNEFTPYPVQQQYPLSYSGTQSMTSLNTNILSLPVFPGDQSTEYSTQFYGGYPLFSIAITPIEMHPQTGNVYWFDTITIEVQSSATSRAVDAAQLLKSTTAHVNAVCNAVKNPQAVQLQSRPTETGSVNYLIITEQAKVSQFEPLRDIHLNRGLNTQIVTYESIISSMTGQDEQEKLRLYLIDFYQENPLQYVLLGGDVDVIPHRGMYAVVGNTTDTDIPADMYYSCLDGNWNTDGDAYWGEPSEADLAPEFAIGRFCYNNDTDIANFIDKVESYLNSPVTDEVKTVLFVGEDLGWTAWGGDYMDEMIGGSSNYGYTTVGADPTDWDVDTLYDRESTWYPSQLMNMMSEGPNMINHLGHSSVGYTMKLYRSDVTNYNLTNNGANHNFFTIFTQGCYGGAFDNRNSNGNYEDDCITEKFVALENGCVTMISNSRYGWGDGQGTNGASQHFHREYNDAIFGENITVLGDALNDSKIDSIPFITQGVMYWCSYETNVLGDPALDIWTEPAANQVVTHPDELFLGATEITVNTAEAGTLVSVHNGTTQYGSAVSDGSGVALIQFDEPLAAIETLTLTAYKHDYYTYTANLDVVPLSGAYVTAQLEGITETGAHIDGSYQVFDTLQLDVLFENIGLNQTAADLTATLSTDNANVTITTDQITVPTLAGGASTTQAAAFECTLDAGLQDNEIISYTVAITDGADTWQSTLQITVSMPEITYGTMTVETTTGSDPQLDPGEEADLTFTYANSGNGFCYDLGITVMSQDPYVTITNTTVVIDQIEPGNSADSQPVSIQISNDCPIDYNAELTVISVDVYGNSIMETVILPIGITAFTFEGGMGEWTHEALSGGFADQWHHSNFRNFTPNGEWSAKCGGTGGASYGNGVHAGLTTPVLYTFGNAYVKFHHWMSAEIETATTAWDGGLIEISHNGGAFQAIQPLGGYPYTVVPNDDSPFDPGTPVFSGYIEWEEVELDLSNFPGTVQLRFVFGTDAAVTEEGWYIDDLVVGSYVDAEHPVIATPHDISLRNYPNPFNPSTTISFNLPQSFEKGALTIYNVKGQTVRSFDLADKAGMPAAEIQWNGSDADNRPVASGVYFYRVQFDNSLKTTRRMLLMK